MVIILNMWWFCSSAGKTSLHWRLLKNIAKSWHYSRTPELQKFSTMQRLRNQNAFVSLSAKSNLQQCQGDDKRLALLPACTDWQRPWAVHSRQRDPTWNPYQCAAEIMEPASMLSEHSRWRIISIPCYELLGWSVRAQGLSWARGFPPTVEWLPTSNFNLAQSNASGELEPRTIWFRNPSCKADWCCEGLDAPQGCR